jgi:hypothetical protein
VKTIQNIFFCIWEAIVIAGRLGDITSHPIHVARANVSRPRQAGIRLPTAFASVTSAPKQHEETNCYHQSYRYNDQICNHQYSPTLIR